MLWSCGRQGGFDLQKWQLQRLVYSSVPSYQLIKAKHKHSQLLLHLLSRHNPKTGRKRTRKLIFSSCWWRQMHSGLHHKSCHAKESRNAKLGSGITWEYCQLCGSKQGGKYELYRNRGRRNGAKTTYIVFGGIPSLLHIHNIHVKDRPELHLHKADRSAPTLGTLQEELLIHANNRQDSSCWEEVQKEAKLLTTKASSQSGRGRIHGMTECQAASALLGSLWNIITQ